MLFVALFHRCGGASPSLILMSSEETFLLATSAAQRGVEVTSSFRRLRSISVYHAQGSYYEELLKADAHLPLPVPVILHSKSISIDDDIVVIAQGNMDIRSFQLNLRSRWSVTRPRSLPICGRSRQNTCAAPVHCIWRRGKHVRFSRSSSTIWRG
jgi:phosphatidylserine/phosphatidylglycerophosphate/cardiolipin synthase-like enzyme